MFQALAIATLVAVACFVVFRVAVGVVSLAWKLLMFGLVVATLVAAGVLSWWAISV